MAIINPDIRITAAARFDTKAAVGNKILKQTLQQQSGTDARRLSRLSLIAALGAGLLRGQGEIRPDCAVFLGTPFSSPSVFEKMADNVLNHHAAMPFDFIANLHNAPVFHAAQTLGTHADTREGSIWILLEHGAEHGVPVTLNTEAEEAERPSRQAAAHSETQRYYWQDIADILETLCLADGLSSGKPNPIMMARAEIL